jgi:glycosyltransferase involved in cell wall biosynthesis
MTGAPVTAQSPDPKPRLSVAIIAKDEEDRIRRLLDSVSFADEIVVVDSGSADSTLEICQSVGAKVFHQNWLGYAGQKQVALELAEGDWILSLDADEVISDSLRVEILEAIKTSDPEINGFSFPRVSWYLNRWIRHGGWFPDRKVRLVRSGTSRWVGDSLHEKLEVDGSVVQLANPIYHYVYRNVFDQIRTVNSFSSTFASKKRTAFPRLYLAFGFFHAFGKFLECAIWKLGFLDGAAGLIIAANSAFYVFLKHAKVWEVSLDNLTKPHDFS